MQIPKNSFEMNPGTFNSVSGFDDALVNFLTNGSQLFKRSNATSRTPKNEEFTPKQPFEMASAKIRFRTPEHQFWWDKTGAQLGELLRSAGYSKAARYDELLLYGNHMVPELGPIPDKIENSRWKSVQTPDGTPLNFSWEWGLEGKGIIGTSFKPVGSTTGTKADPFNRFETDARIKHLDRQGLVNCLDLEWYNHFMASILPIELDRVRATAKPNSELAPAAGTFVTKDTDRNGLLMKLNILPGLRAQELGISNLDVVVRAIRSLPSGQYSALRCEPLLDYLYEAAQRWNTEVSMVSFDLVAPQESRLEIHTRAPNATVECLMDALMLGGRYNASTYSEEAIVDVKDFWRIFIGDAPSGLPSSVERAGSGFSFTVQAGQPAIPRVYILPGSLCKSDAEVLRRLRHYFATRRNAEQMLPQMDNYEMALKGI